MIRVTDFHKAYGSTVAVDGISFEVNPGQILGLIGPNGAGKTTTLRALAGIVPASRGRLLIDDLDIEQEPVETKRRLAFVPDDPPLFNDLTVNPNTDESFPLYPLENLTVPTLLTPDQRRTNLKSASRRFLH